VSKIRDDLVGVVFVAGLDGSPFALAAGAQIPDGVSVGPHLLSEDGEAEPDGATDSETPSEGAGTDSEDGGTDAGDDDGDPVDDTRPPESGSGASKAKWATYAAAHEVTIEDGASREAIIAAVAAAGH